MELYLFSIYDYINKNKKDDIYDIFDKCKNIINKEGYFYFSRLNLLYGIYTNNLNYLDIAYNYANNIYLKLISKLKQIELKLKNNEFDNFENDYNLCEKIKNENEYDISLKNSDIENQFSNLLNLKEKLLNNYVKNKLFFFISEPFYIKEGENNNKEIPLKTESNNSFFLKFKLTTALPNIQFEFIKIKKDLQKLKNCLQYPIKFLYIGSDYFNDEGNICYEEEDFKGDFIKNEKIKKIITESKCKESCDIVILGVLNSENGTKDSLFKIFESNNFRHIIYFRKIDSLNKKLKSDPSIYFYLQKIFFIFIKEFILNLSSLRGCLTIKEAFRRANNNFNEALKKIIVFEEDKQKTPLNNKNQINILEIAGKPENDDDIFDFGLFDEDNINSNNNIEQYNDKEMYDDYDNDYVKQNNIYFRKNPFMNIFEENNDIILGKKYKKFYKFPGIGYLKDEILKQLIEKGFFSMKDILRDVINKIKNNKYTNLFGTEFRGKKKLCEEAFKYFYMNGIFKKGIFIVDLKNINSIKSLPELNSHTIKDIKNQKEILIVIENTEKDKLYNSLFDWIEKLDIHAVFISDAQLSKNKWLNNDNYFYNIDQETKDYRNMNIDFNEEYEIYKKIKFS